MNNSSHVPSYECGSYCVAVPVTKAHDQVIPAESSRPAATLVMLLVSVNIYRSAQIQPILHAYDFVSLNLD